MMDSIAIRRMWRMCILVTVFLVSSGPASVGVCQSTDDAILTSIADGMKLYYDAVRNYDFVMHTRVVGISRQVGKADPASLHFEYETFERLQMDYDAQKCVYTKRFRRHG